MSSYWSDLLVFGSAFALALAYVIATSNRGRR